MKDLAPKIFRQRLVIEGKVDKIITSSEIKKYMDRLCKILKMKAIGRPRVSDCKKFGWAGWMHWETSGCHFYSWEKPMNFFSVGIYTCKKFKVKDAVIFTKDFFNSDNLVYKSI